jgi:hypothetical protein
MFLKNVGKLPQHYVVAHPKISMMMMIRWRRRVVVVAVVVAAAAVMIVVIIVDWTQHKSNQFCLGILIHNTKLNR